MSLADASSGPEPSIRHSPSPSQPPAGGGVAPTNRMRRALDELLMGAAAALVAALLHLAVVRILDLRFSVYGWDWRSIALVWKVPLGYGMVFAPVAVALSLLALALPRGISLRLSATVWLTLVLWAIALFFPAIHGWASLVLAAAVALQLSRLAVRAPDSTRRALRLTGVAYLAVAVAARPAFERVTASRERTAVAALATPAEGAPNVLLLVWDTVRAASLSLYGAQVPTTPQLDSIAAHGVVFDEAYATAPWTLPSHASMFTGRYASATETDFGIPLPPDAPTLAEVLRNQGYATAGFTANLMATRAESGLSRGFIRYEDFTSSAWEVLHSTAFTQADLVVVFLENLRRGRYWRVVRDIVNGGFETHFTVASHDVKRAPTLARDFLAWQDTIPKGRPFFAFINLFDAHDPYQPPPEFLAQVSGPNARTIDRYHGSIRFVDDVVGRMLRELDRRGVLDHTIVVITSDHGEQFGEHGLTLHGNSLYRQVLHVPLLVTYPAGVPTNVRVKEPVTLRDIPATVLALAGVPHRGTGIEGHSLATLWSNSGERTSDVISEVSRHYRRAPSLRNLNGPMQSVVADSVHVIRDGDDRIEAYNVATDGAEERNLTTDAARSASLRAPLDEAVSRNTLRGAKGYARGGDSASKKGAP